MGLLYGDCFIGKLSSSFTALVGGRFLSSVGRRGKPCCDNVECFLPVFYGNVLRL